MATKKVILSVLLAGGLFGAFQVKAMGAGSNFLKYFTEKAELEIKIEDFKAKITKENGEYQEWLRKQGKRANPSQKRLRKLRFKALTELYELSIKEAMLRIEELDRLI